MFKMRPKVAKMRTKMIKIRAKMIKRRLKMAKMRPKIAKPETKTLKKHENATHACTQSVAPRGMRGPPPTCNPPALWARACKSLRLHTLPYQEG